MKTTPDVDYGLLEYIGKQFFSKIIQKYFRAEIFGWEKTIGTRKKVRIFYSNHSGMSFPWDGIVFNTLFWEKNGYEKGCFPRPLIAPMLTQHRINNPYLIEGFWHRVGCVNATMDNFESLLDSGQDVLVYPEGVEGIGKGFDKRYQIQTFSNSFLRMAKKYDAELVPIYTVNGEFLHPYAYKNDKINHFVQKLGIPFLPVSPLIPFVGLYPWMYYFAFPANLRYVIGDPISGRDLFNSTGDDVLGRGNFIKVRNQIQIEFQRELHYNVEIHGQDPYSINDLIQKLREDVEESIYLLPFNWPIVLSSLVHSYETKTPINLRYKMEELFEMTMKHLDAFAFTLPMSWPIVLAMKNYSLELWETLLEFLEEEFHLVDKAAHGLHKKKLNSSRTD
jgi:1-acyl-sn-glycerol-3-phosphate acyltransferase